MSIDRMIIRTSRLADARSHACPVCTVGAGERCNDRWGLPTALVHPSRSALVGYINDPYALDEGPGAAFFATINRSGR